MIKIIFFLLSAFLISCAGKYSHKVNFNASEPIRVVVLPFVQVNQKDEIIEPDKGFLIDDVSIVSSRLNDTPAEYVKRLVQNELRLSGLDIISPAVVESNLSHSGFDDISKNPPLDLDKIRRIDAKDLCSRLLSCDAVLYGKITDWSRSYYAIQSINTVAIDLKLISAKDGSVLFSSTAEDSDSRGITKGPTGFSDLLIEPVRGLDNKIITNLAQKTVKKMLLPLKVENRPDFLNTSPPAIYASAHDAANGRMGKNEPLTVLAFGSSLQSAAFSIGNVIENIPMVEKDKGHYIGKYYPLKNDSFVNQSVRVALTDQFGRTTTQKLGTANLTLE